MKIFYNDLQLLHNPSSYISRGQVVPSPECPERATRLLAAITEAGHLIEESDPSPIGPIAEVHAPDYLNFLQYGYQEWQALPDPGPEIIANVHPGRHMITRPDHIVGKAGYFMADTACPIGKDTWLAATAAAGCAIDAIDSLTEMDEPAYALCRPPGHHAYADMAGGFCFLNNTAIAADRVVQGFLRPAVLDIDVHHGNGTQGIFYDRNDVMTTSVHADPRGFYPFFAGYADERGRGPGAGYNLNVPLASGTADDGWLEAISHCVSTIDSFGTDVLIVALGLDAQENDPLGILKITTEGFRRAGALIGGLKYPTVIIQEGGYLCDELGANLVAFLDGFENR